MWTFPNQEPSFPGISKAGNYKLKIPGLSRVCGDSYEILCIKMYYLYWLTFAEIIWNCNGYSICSHNANKNHVI